MTKLVQALGPSGFGTYAFDARQLSPAQGFPDTLLIPGFVDIHIHGAFGIDFMAAQSKDEIIGWCDKLADVGYEAFLPTTVTATPDDVSRALDNLPQHPMIAGFHLEGPFISHTYPGAQPQAFITTPSAVWESILDDPRLRVITVAPEIEGALELIQRLSARGITISIGHTDATYEQCRKAVEAGARHTTHTYNAMRPLHHREAGTVGFALTEDRLSCELIYDRHHVSREAADILRRSKPADKLIAVSDGTMAAGLPDGSSVKMWNLETVVSGGTVRLPDGTLAGSAITLLDAFRNLAADFGPETAIRACCVNPRFDLGLEEVRVWLEMDRDLRIIDRFIIE